jgi:hypothetical protein
MIIIDDERGRLWNKVIFPFNLPGVCQAEAGIFPPCNIISKKGLSKTTENVMYDIKSAI